MSRPSARFLLSPRWLLSHVLVALLVVTMVNLGFWQLRRLDEKRDRNELIEARTEMPVVPVEELLPLGDDGAVGEARFRRVTAEGTYDDGGTVVVRNRSQEGVAGAWLVTPLELDDGTRVGVLRGFVGLGGDGEPAEAPPPDGRVTVEGIVVDPDSFDGTAPRDVAPLLDEDGVRPGLVLATGSEPPEPAAAEEGQAGRDSLVAVPPPELSEGNHLSYAVQWFIFSTIAVVGYPLVLRNVVQRRGCEADPAVDGEVAGNGRSGARAGADDVLHQGG